MVKSKPSSSNGMADFKQRQLDVVLENNPAHDDYHAWIRDVSDILTYQEAVDDDGGGGFPDFSEADAQRALDSGYITVYSSYPIDLGIFVTPSQMEARAYAGKANVYSRTLRLTDVAWLDSGQGQYTGDVRRRRAR